MKSIVLLMVMFFCLVSFAYAGDVSVKGHWKDTNRDGSKDTYVQPYQRTAPNDTLRDNYSTRGNTNPYTGERGTVDPDRFQLK
jgi:hypothetical protein